MRKIRTRLAALFLLFSPVCAMAGELRDLATDRPDKTESPQTVDAGHAQIELDFATYGHDRSDAERTEQIDILPINLKYGVAANADLQLIMAPYVHQRVTDEATGARTAVGGFGDMTVRLKYNLWGNDGGKTAMALMPFVTLPTAKTGLGADGVEFGLIAPLSVKLSEQVDLAMMTEVDALREDGHYHAGIINSASLGFHLTKRLGLYTELYTEHDRDWIVTGDTGLTYAVGENSQFDLGANIGLTDAADDISLFVGFSRRF